MSNKHLTLQKTLAITILLIGVIGIMLVIATDFTYRKVAYEQQTLTIGARQGRFPGMPEITGSRR